MSRPSHPRFPRLIRAAVAVLAAVTAGALAVPVSGQPTSSTADVGDLFGEVIDVRVVNVEVVVTDRSGARVRGLGPEDFELLVDGRPMPIDFFTEVAGGRARAPGDPVPGVRDGEPVGTRYLVYVDDNHTLKSHRDPVVRGLIEQLPLLGEHDRMAVVVQSGPRVRMLSSWSRSERELRDALERLLDGRELGGSIRSPLFAARRAAIRGRGADAPDLVEDLRRADLLRGRDDLELPTASRAISDAEARIDLELAVQGVVSTLRGFASPPGRKVMLLIGGAWPIGAFYRDDDSLAPVTDLHIMSAMVETANLLGYTLYPVGLDPTDTVWRNAGLAHVAEQTGGRPLYRRATVLEETVADTRSYYWLGFTPALSGDDDRHEIEVRVRRPGLDTRARRGYLDLSRSAELAMSTQSALLFGHETPGAPLSIEVGEASRWGLRKMDVPLTLHVPLDELTFLDQGGVETAHFEVRFAVVDASGSQADVPVISVTLDRNETDGESYRLETSLHMRRRPHELLVSVHDPLGERTLHARAELSFRSTRQ